MSDIIVTVQQGRLKGQTSVDYHGGTFLSFSGIPYAKAPIGELRFKAPQPAEPWEGVKDATKPGWECPSLDMYFGYFVGNENNCLNLNVYTKELPKENSPRKPVMVWIHGGGFIYGCNKSELFGPDYLLTEDIVLVAINYRLGIFGFLSLEDPSLGVPGNAGMKDQTMALKWVQQNIHNFGGDPNNITVFGESAGAASVHYLTLSPLTKGLFHKAIIQSGCALNLWARGKRNAAEVAKCLGYKEKDEKTIFQKLLKESSRKIVNSQFKIEDALWASSERPLGPVIEVPSKEAFLCEDPIDIIKSGRNHQVPMIIGYNSLEGMLYELIRRTRSYANLPKNLEIETPYDLEIPLHSEKSREIGEKIKKFYYNDEDITSEKNIRKRYQLLGDIQFVYGIQKTVRLQAVNGAQTIYVYRNSLDDSLNFFKKLCKVKCFKTMIFCNFLTKIAGHPAVKNIFQSMALKLPLNTGDGVGHADDIFYLFSTFFTPKIKPGSKEDFNIQKFVKLWTNFARCGNPTPERDEKLNNIVWEPTKSVDLNAILEIDQEFRLVKNPEEKQLKFWDDIYKQYSKIQKHA